MEREQIISAMEGILFAAGEPVELSRICTCLEISEQQAEEAAKALADGYSYERRGIRLVRIENSLQLCSAPELADLITRTLETRKPPKLSPAALETLTVVAYYQPTTKAYVEQIRGVDSSYTLGLLLDRGLIEQAGTLSVPGRPRLFRTTKLFLRTFGLQSLSDLPELGDDELLLESAVENRTQLEGQMSISLHPQAKESETD